jgi:hypothetical protein
MRSEGLIAVIEKHFGLAGVELYIRAADGGGVDTRTSLAHDLAVLCRSKLQLAPRE